MSATVEPFDLPPRLRHVANRVIAVFDELARIAQALDVPPDEVEPDARSLDVGPLHRAVNAAFALGLTGEGERSLALEHCGPRADALARPLRQGAEKIVPSTNALMAVQDVAAIMWVAWWHARGGRYRPDCFPGDESEVGRS